MATKVLALASGVTGLADHRVLNSAMMAPAGAMDVQSGVLPGVGSGNLSTVSAMVARVSPVKVLIANGVSSALGAYLLVSDANVDITFDAGEAAVPRTDRIIARVFDDANDGSGSTTGGIYYLKGTSGGSASALPTNSVLLYEMVIPAGASSGGGGVNFANATDRRTYTVAQGGILPVKNNTDMSSIYLPYEGMTIYRTDIDVIYTYDGTTWRPRGQATASSFANLSTINNPYDGMLAVARDTDVAYIYSGSSWLAVAASTSYERPLTILRKSVITNVDNNGEILTWDIEDVDTHGYHSTGSRITPSIPGWYRFTTQITFASNATGRRAAAIYYNGGSARYGSIIPGSSAGNIAVNSTRTIYADGDDYFEVFAYQNSGGALDTADIVGVYFECEFIRP
jgi:hypothetical protein